MKNLKKGGASINKKQQVEIGDIFCFKDAEDLKVAQIQSIKDDDFVFFNDGTHSKQKNLTDAKRISRSVNERHGDFKVLVHNMDLISARTPMYVGDDDPEKLECFLAGMFFHYAFTFPENNPNSYLIIRAAEKERGWREGGNLIAQIRKKYPLRADINKELVEIFKEAFRLRYVELSKED